MRLYNSLLVLTLVSLIGCQAQKKPGSTDEEIYEIGISADDIGGKYEIIGRLGLPVFTPCEVRGKIIDEIRRGSKYWKKSFIVISAINSRELSTPIKIEVSPLVKKPRNEEMIFKVLEHGSFQPYHLENTEEFINPTFEQKHPKPLWQRIYLSIVFLEYP